MFLVFLLICTLLWFALVSAPFVATLSFVLVTSFCKR